MSSFEVLDKIITLLYKKNPYIKELVIIGHSAGGQFVNRYSAGNRMHQNILQNYKTNIRYIVVNPSSYLYFNEERPIEKSSTRFEKPTNS